MHLAVMGRQSLDELQALVARLFADVPNNDLPRPAFGGAAVCACVRACVCVRVCVGGCGRVCVCV